MVSSFVRILKKERLGKSARVAGTGIYERGCVQIFVSYYNTHQGSFTVKGTLCKQVDKITQPVISQALYSNESMNRVLQGLRLCMSPTTKI